jgi:F0F1-type ATP synthase membrane subunit b/b'
MGKKLVDLTIDEVSLVKKGFKPVHQDATIEFFKAFPDEATTETSEGGFFDRIRKAFTKFTKGVVADNVNQSRPYREINEAIWAMSSALDDVQWGWSRSYATEDERKQAMKDIINEGSQLMTASVESIGKSDVSKAMDTTSGADYEQKDISTNSPGKKKKPENETEVKKSVEEFKKAIDEALAAVPETIKKAVEEATVPHLESVKKAQEEVTAAVEKATTDITGLVDTAKVDIAKAIDDAKIELGRVAKATPDANAETKVIKADSKFGDAIRTIMNEEAK